MINIVVKMFKKNIIVFLLCLFSLFFAFQSPVKAIYRASDLISSSWPNASANHTIQFRNSKAIPPNGKIILDFADSFVMPDDMDYSDIDFGVSGNSNGPYIDREVAAIASNITDGIEFSTSTKKITINLNTLTGISAGRYLRILVGSHAVYAVSGSRSIVNPALQNSYPISITVNDSSNTYLESGTVQVAIVYPVNMSGFTRNRYLGASPVGWLNFGTSETIMSIATNYPSRCRYATASGTPFMSMTNDFNYSSSTLYYFNHTVILENLTNGTDYHYYVRCIDESGVRDTVNECVYSSASTTPFMTASGTPITTLDCVDYYIPFSISSMAGEGGGTDTGTGGDDPDETSTGDSTGGGSGSGSGGGGGGGSGSAPGMYLPYPPPPGAPGVVFTGWAYPGREVVFLQDGVEQGRVLAKSDASFSAYVEELVRGVYTFGVWSEDPMKRRSNVFSTTFWLEANTQTTISDIVLTPTISVANSTITAGQMLEVSGHTVPESSVEVWLYPEKNTKVLDLEIVKKTGLSSKTGDWSLYLDTKDLNDGVYLVKARTTVSNKGTSDFGKILKVNIGAAPVVKEGTCAGADLNLDGKVNLTDFSILLYHWGSGHECADQNHDGIVNLTDFSIMMFYWTG